MQELDIKYRRGFYNKCHFDNGDLEKILEICKEFPDEISYENYEDEMSLLRDKRLMFATFTILITASSEEQASNFGDASFVIRSALCHIGAKK